ncbi:MAG: cadherin domain-containing protein [Acidimicrobiales bacterium]
MTTKRATSPARDVFSIRLLAVLALLIPILSLIGAPSAGATITPPNASIFVSSTSPGTVPGANGPIAFRPEDVLLWNAELDEWSMVFDGSDVGVTNVDAVLVESINGTVDMLLSFAAPQTIPDVGAIDDSDVVRFSGSYAGGVTAGSFELVLDGSDVGLSAGGEDVDAVATSPGSGMVLSTVGNASVPRVDGGTLTAADEDLTTLASGSFSALFDGSDVGVTSEDVQAAYIDNETGVLYGAMQNNFTAGAVSGDADDVWAFAGTTGANTNGQFSKVFDGDLHDFGNEAIDALSITFEPPAPAGISDLSVTITDLQDPVDSGDQLAFEVNVHNNGPDAAANIAVALSLPAEVTFGHTTGCISNGLSCSLGAIAPNDSKTFNLFVDVDPGTSGTISTTATVSSTNTDPASENNSAFANTVVQVAPVTGGDIVYLSSNRGGTVGAPGNVITYANEDVLAYDAGSASWSMHFDGSDVGLGGADIDGIYVADTGLDFSLTRPFTIPGLGRVDDSDIVRFTGTTGDTTSGSFQLVVDGSAIGLAAGGEDIDAVTMKDSSYLVSTTGAFNDGHTSGSDEDALHLTGTTTTLLFDGSDVDLQAEDLVAAHFDHATGTVYGVSLNSFRVTGLTGDRNDIFAFTGTTGAATSGSYSLYLDAGSIGFSDQIDATHIGAALASSNQAPAITSYGGAATAVDNVHEGASNVENLNTTDDNDSEGAGLTYSITGGADAALFGIQADQGVLLAIGGFDFENPTDSDDDGIYEVQVTVTDSGGLTDSVDISVTANDRDADLSVAIDNGQTEITEDPTTYTIDVTNNGPDPAFSTVISWSLDSGLQFTSFDPGTSNCVLDTNTNTSCNMPSAAAFGLGASVQVTVTATPINVGTTVTTTASVTSRVDDLVNPTNNTDTDTDTQVDTNQAPTIISYGGAATAADTVQEGAGLVKNLSTTDDNDSEGSGLTYSITGTDSSSFGIGAANGVLTALGGLDFENPTDRDGDGIYEVRVTVTDSGGLTDSVDITVTVNDLDADLSVNIDNGETEINDDPTTYTIDVTNNGPDTAFGAAISWSLDNGLQFTSFDPGSSGCVLDTNTNTSCDMPPATGFNPGASRQVTVTATPINVGTTVTTTATVTSRTDDLVNPANNTDTDTDTQVKANQAPTITSYGGATAAADTLIEGASLVENIEATDDNDSESSGLIYSISGLDSASFSISPNSGVLFVPGELDFENPTDVNGDGIYEVRVTVTDSGGLTDSVDISVTVNDEDADLSILIDNQQDLAELGPTTYMISVANIGPSTALGTTISWELDAGVTFTSFDPGTSGCVLNTTTNSSCSFPASVGLLSGGTIEVSVTANIESAASEIETTATVASLTDDLIDTDNNTDTDTDTSDPL